MVKKLFGLGKGLGSLIPADSSVRSAEATAVKESVFYIEVGKIRPNPDQPRQDFDADALKELSNSIRRYGVLQPLLVSKKEDHGPRGMDVFYELIAGERRLRAAQMAGLPTVPVIIKDDLGNEKSTRLQVALIENVQRDDLNGMEEAEAYARLASEFGLTQQEIAQKVGKSRETVANTMRLMKLPDNIKQAIRSGKIGATHGRALLAFSDPTKQQEMFRRIVEDGFSKSDIELASSRDKGGRAGTNSDRRFEELQSTLCERLKAPVLIKTGARGGQIVIRFADHEELNLIARNIID